MTPERWRQIEGLCREAMDRDATERNRFLEQACAGDDELRGEVESLLSKQTNAGSFLAEPAVHQAAKELGDTMTPLASGAQLGSYRIEQVLGRGGMGVVYRAFDTRLNRPVAIKVLPDDLADAAARRRFQREAQMASALNHPHILTVYDAGEFESRQYLVCEFVDGGTLRSWLKQKRTWREIVDLLAGVADGLAAAHAAGILHRDIKPDNVLVAKNGYAKLGDFGLAKLAETTTDLTETLTEGRTQPGMIIGSIPYMSPEQASGKPVDTRSDIFSFGVLLYEALSSRRPFLGATDIQVLRAIMHGEAPPLPASVPPALRSIVDKAIEKEPADRYQTMRDMVVDLRRAVRAKIERANAFVRPERKWLPLSVAAAALVLGIVVGVWLRGRPETGWHNPLEGATFTRLTDFEGVESDAVISPDGNFVAFVSDRDGPRDIWILQLGSGQFLNLTQGKVTGLAPAQMMSFTPDGSQVTFGTIHINPADGKQINSTSIVPTIGGAARSFLEARVAPKWSADASRLLFFSLIGNKDVIYTADSAAGNPRELFTVGPGEHNHYVAWSSDGRHVYTVRSTENLQEFDVWRAPAAGGKPERITHHNAYVAYPAALDEHTLLYIAADENGTGTWLYATDSDRREPHQLSVGIEQYSSIAVSAPAPGRKRRLVATVANPTGSLWFIPIADSPSPESAATPFQVPSAGVSSPRFGPDYLLYLSSQALADSL
jgi:hypothetical protein